MFEVGIGTFAEITTDITTGKAPSAGQRLRETLEQAKVADEVGLDLFGVGEHHRRDFAASAPSTILAAISQITERIRLSSSVTILSSDDPVRVWEQYATLDLLSDGRAEIMAGRGSYTESFPLFGYDLRDYGDLFDEKLDLLLKIREEDPISWDGRLRPSLTGQDVAPRAAQTELPIWQAVGGSPASAAQAGRLGLPMMIAFLVGPIVAHQAIVQQYWDSAQRAGVDPTRLKTGAAVHGFVAPTSQEAKDIMFPYFARGMMENNHQRGEGFSIPRMAFEAQASPAGMPVVGSPQEVIDKVMTYHEVYGISRFFIQLGFGGVPQKEHLRAIELLGTEVAPVLRKETADFFKDKK